MEDTPQIEETQSKRPRDVDAILAKQQSTSESDLNDKQAVPEALFDGLIEGLSEEQEAVLMDNGQPFPKDEVTFKQKRITAIKKTERGCVIAYRGVRTDKIRLALAYWSKNVATPRISVVHLIDYADRYYLASTTLVALEKGRVVDWNVPCHFYNVRIEDGKPLRGLRIRENVYADVCAKAYAKFKKHHPDEIPAADFGEPLPSEKHIQSGRKPGLSTRTIKRRKEDQPPNDQQKRKPTTEKTKKDKKTKKEEKTKKDKKTKNEKRPSDNKTSAPKRQKLAPPKAKTVVAPAPNPASQSAILWRVKAYLKTLKLEDRTFYYGLFCKPLLPDAFPLDFLHHKADFTNLTPVQLQEVIILRLLAERAGVYQLQAQTVAKIEIDRRGIFKNALQDVQQRLASAVTVEDLDALRKPIAYLEHLCPLQNNAIDTAIRRATQIESFESKRTWGQWAKVLCDSPVLMATVNKAYEQGFDQNIEQWLDDHRTRLAEIAHAVKVYPINIDTPEPE